MNKLTRFCDTKRHGIEDEAQLGRNRWNGIGLTEPGGTERTGGRETMGTETGGIGTGGIGTSGIGKGGMEHVE